MAGVIAGIDALAPRDDARQADVLGELTPGWRMVSLATLRSAIWRTRRFWIATAIAGTIAGAGLHLVIPRTYKAEANLYLVEPEGSDPQQAMATDVSLLETRAVADRVVSELHLHLRTDQFLSSYQGSVVSNAIMSITLAAHTQSNATLRTNAVAEAFLAFRSEEIGRQTQIVVNGLQDQVDELNASVDHLTKSISSLSGPNAPATPQSNNLVADLVSQRTGDETQVSQLQAQIQQDNLNLASLVGGSHVLDRAAVIHVSAKRVFGTDGISGFVGGLGLGLVAVVMVTALSDRVRRREDLASALGAPVDLSIERFRPPRVSAERRLRRILARPDQGLRLLETRLRAALDSSPTPSLAIVAVGPPEPAALATALLARTLAGEGKRVALFDVSERHKLAAVLGRAGARKGAGTRTVEGLPILLEVADVHDLQPLAGSVPAGSDLVLTLATIDPSLGSEHLRGLASRSVFVVTAGKASATGIQAAATLARKAGMPPMSAMLIGVDRSDDSLGTTGNERPIPLKSSWTRRPMTEVPW